MFPGFENRRTRYRCCWQRNSSALPTEPANLKRRADPCRRDRKSENPLQDRPVGNSIVMNRAGLPVACPYADDASDVEALERMGLPLQRHPIDTEVFVDRPTSPSTLLTATMRNRYAPALGPAVGSNALKTRLMPPSPITQRDEPSLQDIAHRRLPSPRSADRLSVAAVVTTVRILMPIRDLFRIARPGSSGILRPPW